MGRGHEAGAEAGDATGPAGVHRTSSYHAAVQRATTRQSTPPAPSPPTTAAAPAAAASNSPRAARQGPPKCLDGRLCMSPYQFLRYIGFLWVTPLVRTGLKRQLNADDFRELPDSDRAARLTDRLEAGWERTRQPTNTHGRALLAAFRYSFGGRWLLNSLKVFIETCGQVAQPVLLNRLIRDLIDEEPASRLYLDAMWLSLATLLRTIALHAAFFEGWRFGMDLRNACIGLVYRKALRCTNQAISKISTGMVVNLVSNDVERFTESALFSHYLWIAPMQGIVVTYLIYLEIGASAFAGMGLLILLLPCHMLATKYFAHLRHSTATRTDDRVKTMSEILGGINILKMYGWEGPFSDQVSQQRADELAYIRKSSFIRVFNIVFFFVAVSATSFLSFLVYELAGNELSTRNVFTVIALFGAARPSLALNLPLALHSLAELKVAFVRIERFLTLDDVDEAGQDRRSVSDPRIETKGLSCSWLESGEDDAQVLRDVSFSLSKGELLCVVGPVGAGKSSLLMALLGELAASRGSVTVKGSVAYASQSPWILSRSVRDNIVFGGALDEQWLDSVVKLCQLERDIQGFTHGLDTLIGERGVTLSGGQKARLSLARAVYSRADILLLDDPLSAVDAKVAAKLFSGCIRREGGPMCVLVTHQLQFARLCPRILVLGKGGSVLGLGSYAELSAGNRDLSHWAMHWALGEAPGTGTEAAAGPGKGKMHGKGEHGGQEEEEEEEEEVEMDVDAAPGRDQAMAAEEHRQKGQVAGAIFLQYFRSMGSVAWRVLLVVLFVSTQVAQLVADWFLSYWTDLDDADREDRRNLGIYAGLVLLFLVLAGVRAGVFITGTIRASQHLHDKAFDGVIGSPLRFFHTQAHGRILNRFAKDLGYMDDLLPMALFDFVQLSTLVLGVVLLTSIVNPPLFALTVPLVACFFVLRYVYIQSAREVKRLEGVARSPVYAHFSNTLMGLPIIRSYPGAVTRFRALFEELQDGHGRAYFYFIVVSRWLGVRLDALVFVYVTGVAFGSVLRRNDGSLNPGEIALSLAYSLQLTGFFQWCVRQSAEVENHMTSCERILEYSQLPRERDFVSSLLAKPGSGQPGQPVVVAGGEEPDGEGVPPADWPSAGEILFEHLSLKYAPELPLVIQDLTLHIKPRQKIGIVGRTGAGKSSLLAALFRLAPTSGEIYIDGVAASTLPLATLRRAISVIPQDPVLFSGTSVRKNLDPFDAFDDVRVWQALADVHLQEAVERMPEGLHSAVLEGGGNFSVGQRQLICLARAILRTSRILILDEATADVDTATDRLIQETIRAKFRDCTVLTIAHRLNTIMDSDAILVMAAGRRRELGAPAELLARPGSEFASLVAQARTEGALP